MGIAYVCKPNRKLAVVVWDGLVTSDAWREHLQRMLIDPNYAPMQSQITDLRYSSISPTISDDQIKAMVDLMESQRKNISLSKFAIVAGSEWNKPQLAAFGLKSISVNPIVFNDLETACLWLGVDGEEVGKDIQQLRLKLRQGSS
jgi:hypothetical protein